MKKESKKKKECFLMGGRVHLLVLWIFCTGFLLRIGAGEEVVPKQGGVCFRYDDIHKVREWEEMADLFERNGFRMCLAVMPDSFATPQHGECLAQLAKREHEIMDHTPEHSMFQLRYPTKQEFEEAAKLPFVAETRPGSNWVFFRYEFRKDHPENARFTGSVSGNELTVADPEFLNRLTYTRKIYIPSTGKIYGIRIQDGRRRLFTFWGTGGVNLSLKNEPMILCSDLAIRPSGALIRYMAERSRRGFRKYGIPDPKVWCQPGGWEPFLTVEEIRDVYEKEFHYGSASCVPEVYPYFNCFNDPDPDRYRFAMRPMFRFFDEEASLDEIKKRIVDSAARHRVLIFLSHMNTRRIPGGWKTYMESHGQLLAWLREKRIPVRTQTQWAEILYSKKADPTVDMMPPLTVDLNDDGIPDGWDFNSGAEADLAKGEAILPRTGILEVNGLAGLEKGRCRFSLRCRGAKGARILVDFEQFPHREWRKPSAKQTAVFEMSGDTGQLFTQEVEIKPETVVMNLRIRTTADAAVSSPVFRKIQENNNRSQK